MKGHYYYYTQSHRHITHTPATNVAQIVGQERGVENGEMTVSKSTLEHAAVLIAKNRVQEHGQPCSVEGIVVPTKVRREDVEHEHLPRKHYHPPLAAAPAMPMSDGAH
jgi:hypothetical protein